MDLIDYTPQTCQVCGLIDYQMFFGCRRCIANEYKDVTLTIKFHHNGDFEHWTFTQDWGLKLFLEIGVLNFFLGLDMETWTWTWTWI